MATQGGGLDDVLPVYGSQVVVVVVVVAELDFHGVVVWN